MGHLGPVLQSFTASLPGILIGHLVLFGMQNRTLGPCPQPFTASSCTVLHLSRNRRVAVVWRSLPQIRCTWSYLACRIGHLGPVRSHSQHLPAPWMHLSRNRRVAVVWRSLPQIRYTWSYLACRTGHLGQHLPATNRTLLLSNEPLSE
jgi:hypothetical protein